MRTFKPIHKLLIFIMAIGGLEAGAQAFGPVLNAYLSGMPVVVAKTAVSTSIPIIVRYTGTAGSGKVAVDASTGDLTFTSGVEGSEAADASFECPVTGALGGVIDVSDTACNTLGEVVDTINGTCTGCIKNNWTAVILDGLRADSSNNTLITLAATAATNVNGLGLLSDDTVSLTTTLALTPFRTLAGYVQNPSGGVSRYTLVANPLASKQSVMFQTQATVTSTGTLNWSYYCVLPTVNATSRQGGETVITYAAGAAGATTVSSVKDFPYGFACPTGYKLMTRVTTTTDLTAANQGIAGRIWAPTP